MNHSGDANKMVETPRTDAHIDGLRRDPEVSGCDRTLDFARQFERELNAANERIKQLEDARTVSAANSLANMLAYEDAVAKIKRLEEAGDALKAAGYFGGFGDAVNKWIKSKEDKP